MTDIESTTTTDHHDARASAADTPATPTPGFEAEALTLARAMFEEMGEIGVRQALIDTGNGGRALAAIPNVRGHRDAIMDALRALLRRERAVGVAVLSESWHAPQPAGVPRSALPADLSTYEGRLECVSAFVEHRALEGGATRVWRAEITRDTAGAPTLGPWQLGVGETYSGRMVGLLPPLEGAAHA